MMEIEARTSKVRRFNQHIRERERESEVDDETVSRMNFGLRHTEGQNDETYWSWVLQDKDGDPLAESIFSLQMTQEVLESGKRILFVDVYHALCF
jgi:hypothetical protein